MSDQTFADVVRHAEGDLPTSAELDRMRSHVVAAIDEDNVEHLDLGLLRPTESDDRGAPMSTTRIATTILGIAAAVLLIIGIAVLATGSDGDDDLIETTTPTPVPTESVTPEPTEIPTPTPTPPEAEADATAPPGTQLLDEITAVPIRLDAATYWLDDLGTEVTIEVGEQWTAHRNTQGRLVLGDAFTQGPGDNDIVFIRASLLADPTQPLRVDGDWLWWPADDIDAWITEAAPGIEISNIRDTDIGGYRATAFDVVLDTDRIECISKGCIRFATNDQTYALLGISDLYRIWFIDQGDFEPLVVVAAGDRSAEDFLARAEELVADIELGEAQPMPTTN